MAGEGQGRASATLGDLLYGHTQGELASEQDWVGLISAIGRGDRRALRILYERTWQIVFTLIMRIVREREAAEELTLDVFHDVWRRARSYEAGSGTVVGWVMNQARFRAIEHLRCRSPAPLRVRAAEPVRAASPEALSPETL
jgi:RNA polymerase sigma-70 factor (ECF subfamily)